MFLKMTSFVDYDHGKVFLLKELGRRCERCCLTKLPFYCQQHPTVRAQRYTICLPRLTSAIGLYLIFHVYLSVCEHSDTLWTTERPALFFQCMGVDQTEAVGLEDEPLPVEASLWAPHLHVWSPSTPEDSQFSQASETCLLPPKFLWRLDLQTHHQATLFLWVLGKHTRVLKLPQQVFAKWAFPQAFCFLLGFWWA